MEHGRSGRDKTEAPKSLPSIIGNEAEKANMTRRIRNRLFDLEIQTNSMDQALSAAAVKMLVEILAKRDALFHPWRVSIATPRHLESMPAILARQRAYRDRTEGIMVKADGRRNWKLAHATRLELVSSRMVDPISSGGQITSMVLSPMGQAYARAVVGCLQSFDDASLLLERLERLEKERRPVSESRLFGQELSGDPSDWEPWTEAMLPLIVDGAVDATSDTEGRIYYSSTGRSVPAEIQRFDIEPFDDAVEWYGQAFAQERMLLDSLESDSGEVFIPLPRGI
jgi:hypothetical protein